MPWGWIFAQVIGDGRSTKIAKIIIVHWRLTILRRGQVCFPMHLDGHHTVVWENCWEFQTTSPLKPLGRCSSNFMWSLLRLGEWKIAKMVAVHWPNMVKTFKNLLLQNQGCLGAESLYNSSGTGGLPKLLKWWSYIEVWLFYGEVKFASLCICIGTIHLYGKNVENFKQLLLWSLLANVAQISCGASLGWGNENLLKWSLSIDQDGCHAHIW